MLQLNAEKTARKLFEHGPGYFDAVFLTHSPSSFLNPSCRKDRPSG
jgi:hypothetical protein